MIHWITPSISIGNVCGKLGNGKVACEILVKDTLDHSS